ncbi:MAG: VanZ family protein [Planctomycetota bacterium]|nr:VanZ family protein [Planctomycetota bacterium]
MDSDSVDGEALGSGSDQVWAGFLRRTGRALLRLPRSLAWLPPLAWAGLIFALSSFRAPLGELPGSGAMAFLGNLAHAFEFGVLLLLLVPLLERANDWVVWNPGMTKLLPGAAFLFAISDEVHQSRVPGRDASLLDLCTDLAGILSVYWVVRRLERPTDEVIGVRTLLGRCLLLCCACALAATIWGVVWDEGPWPFPH